MDILPDKLHALIAPVLQNFNADFVALELKGGKQNKIVRVVVDQDGGIPLDTCTAISRALSAELEAADVMPGRYRLEVSSPGTDWPLKSKRDFERNRGRLVNLEYRRGETTASAEGSIEQVTETEITIASAAGSIAVPLAEVQVGRLKLKW
jgi:ribosome maturation factor RimP